MLHSLHNFLYEHLRPMVHVAGITISKQTGCKMLCSGSMETTIDTKANMIYDL